MPALSKKYKINYKRRYTIPKNKKLRGHKSIKVYHNRVKPPTRKRAHYMGGDIEVPVVYDIFPSGQSYQPNTDCLEKECDKKNDAGEKTTTCLNTRIVMNLFSQTLDDSENATMDRIDSNFTQAERKHVEDLTQKYLTNYVDSLFPKSFFSKNNADLTPQNAIKLKELLAVINPEYVVYLTQTSTLSDEIKQKIRDTTQPALNVVVAPLVEMETDVEMQPEPEAETDVEISPEPEAEADAQIPPESEAAAEVQIPQEAEAEAEAQRQQAAEAEAEAQKVAKKAAKKAEEDRFNAAKKEEMEQRFAKRRADSAAADVKRKEDLAEKKAARAADALIKEENRAAAKTLKNTTALKKSSGNGTRKKR